MCDSRECVTICIGSVPTIHSGLLQILGLSSKWVQVVKLGGQGFLVTGDKAKNKLVKW